MRSLPCLPSCVLSVVLGEVPVRLLIRIGSTGAAVRLIDTVDIVLLIVHNPWVVETARRNLVV